MDADTSPTRPKLLFLAQCLPYPLDSGVKVRTYNVLRLLARTFDVTAMCFYRRYPGMSQEDVLDSVAALRPFGAVEAFPIPQEHSRVRLLWDHLRSVAHRRAYTVYAYESVPFRQRLTQVLAGEKFDLVHIDSLDLSGYFPLLGGMPIVCTHHDAQSVLLSRRSQAQTSFLRKWYFAHQAELTENEERAWCPRATLNVTVSQTDADVLSRVAPGSAFHVVPNGVDTEFFQPGAGSGGGILFVGGTGWFPNRDGIEYFCESILPILRARGVTAPVTIVGQATETERAEFQARYGVMLTGLVPDIRPYLAAAECFVVPIRVGGGTRIKILDAWAMGRAIVSTSIGCEGLDATDGENILIRDIPEGFADAVAEVLSKPELRSRLGQAARRTAEQVYSWEVIGKRMVETYLHLQQCTGA